MSLGALSEEAQWVTLDPESPEHRAVVEACGFFDLGAPGRTWRLPGGFANHNIVAESTDGTRTLLKLAVEHTLREVELELRYVGVLADAGAVVAPYLASAERGAVYAGARYPVTAQRFIDAPSPASGDLTCGRAGELLARIHQVTAAGLPPRRHWLLPDEIRRRAAALQRARLPEATPMLAACSELLAFEYDRLPLAVTRGDVHEGNMLAPDGGGLMLIDWEEVSLAPALLDIGSAVLNLGLDDEGQVITTRHESLMRAYQAVRPLCLAETRRLAMAVRYTALATGLWVLHRFGLERPAPHHLEALRACWDYNPRPLALALGP